MGFQFIKKNLHLIIISSFFIINKCINFDRDDEDELFRLMDELRKKKDECLELERDEEIFDFIYKILLGLIIFFLIIIFPIVICEIINCCKERKRELERKTLIVKNLTKSRTTKNFSLKLSNVSNSSIDDEIKEGKIENSFHSSKILASTVSKREINNNYNYNSNNIIEKSNMKESNFSKQGKNCDNGAPSIGKIYYNNNKEEKLLTNDINIEDGINIYKN